MIRFLLLLAPFVHGVADLIDEELAREPEAAPEPPADPPSVPSSPPPAAIAGETYAEYFARTGYLLKGPDDHEISGFHVFDGHAWVPATA